MPTASDILRLQIMELATTDWHTKTEANLNRLEESIASEVNVSTTGGTTTLSSSDYIADQSRRPVIRVTGTLASNAIIQVPTPDSAKLYAVYNGTSGSFTVTIRNGASGGTVEIPQGTSMLVVAIATGTLMLRLSPPMTSTGQIWAVNGFTADHVLNRGQVDSRVLPLKSKTEATPPVSPTLDDAYYVPSGATGAWSGQTGKIARYNGSGWTFSDLPAEGMLAAIADEGTVFVAHSSALTDFVGSGNVADGAITEAKLATNSVVTAKIADLNVTEGKLAANAVALAKLKSDVYASENEAKTGTSTTKLLSVAMGKHAAFGAGVRAVFQQTAAPTGWTKDTGTSGLNNSALRFVTGTASSGGTSDFTTAFASRTPAGTVGNTTLTLNQIPGHQHYSFTTEDVGSGGPQVGASDYPAVIGGGGSSNDRYLIRGTATPANAGLSSPSGGGQSHTHTFTGTAMDFAVKYTDTIVAVKDSPT